MPNENTPHEELQLQSKIEALLFVATGSITIGQLALALEISTHEIEIGLDQLELHYKQDNHGLRIQRYRGRIQLTSAPELAPIIEKYLGLEVPSRLSRAALETLAIIAYQQPTTRPEIDSIRGVNSDGVLRTLLMKGLIEEVGRAERPGRPILFITTADFLQYFGLSSLDDLPPLDFNSSEDHRTDNLEAMADHPLINNLKG
jgi:segregation and condensation protein B